MEIKTSTEYTAERLIRFNTAHMLKSKLRWILFAIVTLIFFSGTVLAVVKGIINSSADGVAFYVVLLVIILFIDFYMIYASFISPRIKISKSPFINAKLNVTFYDEEFVTHGQTDKNTTQNSHSYNLIDCAIKSREDLYLYVSKSHAYIVDLSNLNEEQKTQIKEKLQNAKSIKWK